MKNLTETNAELKAYIAGLKEKENRNKLVGLVIAGSVIIALLVAGIVYLIKKRCDEECYDDWDDEWDDKYDECCCGDECCCTDEDVDKSVKVEPFNN